MANVKWVKHIVDDCAYWDLVDADTYEEGDHNAYLLCYRESDYDTWEVMYDDDVFPNGTDDKSIPKSEFPTYQRLRKHLLMQYLLLRET